MSASGPASTPAEPQALAQSLRQMVAALESERQALAALDLDAITVAATDKDELCGVITLHDPAQNTAGHPALDEECRALLIAAKQKNETNRRIRNLLAANVEARIEALSGTPGLYRKPHLQRA
jgi:DNA-binding transcriptional regulator YbjK